MARGVINIVIEYGFELELEDKVYNLETSIFDVKREHRLKDIHSTIHMIRVDVGKCYDELVAIGKNKNLI
jgi:hypothetical protein